MISHVLGESLLVADALSRTPCSDPVDEDTLLQQETAVYVNTVVQSLPVTERQLERIRQYQEEDEVELFGNGTVSGQNIFGCVYICLCLFGPTTYRKF